MEEEQRHETAPGEALSPEDDMDFARLVESIPFAAFARRQAQYAESRLLQGLKRKLDGLDDAIGKASQPLAAASAALQSARDPGSAFQQLLDQSLDQRRDTAEIDLLGRLVEQLSCDEARILSALSDREPV
ncbi:MAG: hypothetical protein ACX94A_14230, partial [Algiphilus sp.]